MAEPLCTPLRKDRVALHYIILPFFYYKKDYIVFTPCVHISNCLSSLCWHHPIVLFSHPTFCLSIRIPFLCLSGHVLFQSPSYSGCCLTVLSSVSLDIWWQSMEAIFVPADSCCCCCCCCCCSCCSRCYCCWGWCRSGFVLLFSSLLSRCRWIIVLLFLLLVLLLLLLFLLRMVSRCVRVVVVRQQTNLGFVRSAFLVESGCCSAKS